MIYRVLRSDLDFRSIGGFDSRTLRTPGFALAYRTLDWLVPTPKYSVSDTSKAEGRRPPGTGRGEVYSVNVLLTPVPGHRYSIKKKQYISSTDGPPASFGSHGIVILRQTDQQSWSLPQLLLDQRPGSR